MALNNDDRPVTGIDNRWWWIAGVVALVLLALMFMRPAVNDTVPSRGANSTTAPVTAPITPGAPTPAPSR